MDALLCSLHRSNQRNPRIVVRDVLSLMVNKRPLTYSNTRACRFFLPNDSFTKVQRDFFSVFLKDNFAKLHSGLRIHEILMWIRIRGSMPLTNGSGFGSGSGCRSGSCYFRHGPSRCQQKTNLKKKFFCLLLFEGTYTSFFINKKSKRCHKAVGIKVFLTIFAW